MPTVTIGSFNVEWMNDWFTADADPVVAFKPTFTRDVTRRPGRERRDEPRKPSEDHRPVGVELS